MTQTAIHSIWVGIHRWHTTCSVLTAGYIVLEMAHKGVIMQIDLHQVATPYTESTSRYHFRQIILGIEYRKYCMLLRVSDHLFKTIVHCNDIVHRGTYIHATQAHAGV